MLKTTRVMTAMVLHALAAAILAPATAAIAPGNAQTGANASYSGNGELFLAAFDPTSKVSFALDLGVQLDDFFVWGQQDGGNQRFWVAEGEHWDAFLGRVDRKALRWSVLGFDTTGGTAAGGVRLLTTARQGDEARIAGFTNQLFTNGTGASQAGTFFNAVNGTGSHGVASTAADFGVNGSSVNADPDPGNAYFGIGSPGLSSTLNGNAPFDNSNAIGRSSWFYLLTRSGVTQSGTVLVDEFDNLSYDGYWGFVYVDPALHPDSPYVDRYLLSYTMRAHETPDEASSAPLALFSRFGLALPPDWERTSPVPEPGKLGLWTAGLLALAAWARRRRR